MVSSRKAIRRFEVPQETEEMVMKVVMALVRNERLQKVGYSRRFL